jgi:hypothetical protein
MVWRLFQDLIGCLDTLFVLLQLVLLLFTDMTRSEGFVVRLVATYEQGFEQGSFLGRQDPVLGCRRCFFCLLVCHFVEYPLVLERGM